LKLECREVGSLRDVCRLLPLAVLALCRLRVPRVHCLDDDPPTRLRSATLVLRLLAPAVSRIIDEVEDPAAGGGLVLPPVEGLAIVGPRPVGLAFETLLS
jgi:hypothetical protein